MPDPIVNGESLGSARAKINDGFTEIATLQGSAMATPQQFGAVGDGATNDRAALQAFIDAGGGWLAGKSYATQTALVVLRSDVILLGPGEIRNVPGTSPPSLIYIGDNLSIDTTTPVNRVIIRGVRFAQHTPDGSRSAINFGSDNPMRSIWIDQCEFEQVGEIAEGGSGDCWAIVLVHYRPNPVEDLWITNNSCWGGWQFTASSPFVCRRLRIVGNNVLNGQNAGIAVSRQTGSSGGLCEDLLIAYNQVVCDSSVPMGIGIFVGVDSGATPTQGIYRNLQIIGNTIRLLPSTAVTVIGILVRVPSQVGGVDSVNESVRIEGGLIDVPGVAISVTSAAGDAKNPIVNLEIKDILCPNGRIDLGVYADCTITGLILPDRLRATWNTSTAPGGVLVLRASAVNHVLVERGLILRVQNCELTYDHTIAAPIDLTAPTGETIDAEIDFNRIENTNTGPALKVAGAGTLSAKVGFNVWEGGAISQNDGKVVTWRPGAPQI